MFKISFSVVALFRYFKHILFFYYHVVREMLSNRVWAKQFSCDCVIIIKLWNNFIERSRSWDHISDAYQEYGSSSLPQPKNGGWKMESREDPKTAGSIISPSYLRLEKTLRRKVWRNIWSDKMQGVRRAKKERQGISYGRGRERERSTTNKELYINERNLQ